MNKKILTSFLVKAKINTYASKGEAEEKNIFGGGKELIFKENNLKCELPCAKSAGRLKLNLK